MLSRDPLRHRGRSGRRSRTTRDFGLSGSVWTSDVEHAAKIAARLRTGTVPINSAMLLDFRSPFGGFKKSGIGRELGPEGIAPYTEYQSIIFPS